MSSPIGIPEVDTSGTEKFGTDDLVLDVSRNLVELGNGSAPMHTWLSHTAGRMVKSANEDYYWNEVQYDYTSFEITAGLTGGAATEANKVIDSPEVVEGDTFAHAGSGQYFIVDAVASRNAGAGTSTCTLRGVGGDIEAVAAGSCILVPCGIALGDGQFYPTAKGIKPRRKSNTVTVRTSSVEVTHGADRATTYYGSVREMNNQRALKVFKKDMERDLTHSTYSVMQNYVQSNPNGSRSGGSTIRFTRGIIKSSTDHTMTYAGDLDEDTWDEFLGTEVFHSAHAGSPDKLAFFGQTALRKLHKSLKDRIRLTNGPAQDKYGLRIMQYMTAAGNTVMLFQEEHFTNISPYDKGVMVLDPEFIWLRYNGSAGLEIYDTSMPRQASRSLAIEANYGLEMRYAAETTAILKQN